MATTTRVLSSSRAGLGCVVWANSDSTGKTLMVVQVGAETGTSVSPAAIVMILA